VLRRVSSAVPWMGSRGSFCSGDLAARLGPRMVGGATGGPREDVGVVEWLRN
jgi:hypothetical protein